MQKKSFKLGDRVFYASRYGSQKLLKGYGVISDVNGPPNQFFVIPDVPHRGFKLHEPIVIQLDEYPEEVLEVEAVYNSPLYKALS
jgi:hypothetical protein